VPQKIQRSFTSGEVSPAIQSRADLNKYITGLNLCENFFVRTQGGAYNRPGFRFIGEVSDSSQRPRLIPFSFNTEQTYILVFEDMKLRVIRDGQFVTVGGGASIFELTTPYTESEIQDLNYTQNADVLTIAHPSHPPANLSRLADDNWTLADINFSPTVTPPTFTASATVRTVTFVSNSDPTEVTAVGHGFVTGNLVTLNGVTGLSGVNGETSSIVVLSDDTFEMTSLDTSGFATYTGGGTATRENGANTIGSGFGDFNRTYSYAVTAVDSNGVESLASPTVGLTTRSLSQTGGVRLRWGAVAGAEYYRVYKDPSVGTGVFGWIGDSNSVTFDDYNIAPITSDAPPEDRQPFSGAGNSPSSVTYYQQRQVFANTFNEPQSVYTTQTANFSSLRTSTPARDDDAVTFTVVANQVNEIRHLISLDSLIILTSGGEWILTEGQDRVLTPSTIGVRIQSYNGASKVRPVVINSTALFLQEKGTRIRDLGYEFSSDKYTGNDLTVMSEHLFENHIITDMSYSSEPYSIVWCIRDDGVLLGLTYQREHQVWGWHQHTTAGEFESVATVTEDGRDAVYVTVKRTIQGQTRRFVERLEPRESTNVTDCFYVDSGLTYDGPEATTFSGLDHLEGETVKILSDGYTQPDEQVVNGSVTLGRAASKVHIGLGYTSVIETLDLDVNASTETLKTQAISISKVTLEVERSRGGYVGARLDFQKNLPPREIKPRFESDGYGTIDLKTFKMEIFADPQWAETGSIRVEQRDPLPLALLSIIPQADIGGN